MKDTKLHFLGAEDVLAASTIAKPGGKKLAFKSKKLFHQYRVIIIMTSIFMSFWGKNVIMITLVLSALVTLSNSRKTYIAGSFKNMFWKALSEYLFINI